MDEWTRKITKGIVVLNLIAMVINELSWKFRPSWVEMDRSNTFIFLGLALFTVLFRIQILMFEINDKRRVK